MHPPRPNPHRWRLIRAGAVVAAIALAACVDRITYVDRPVTVPGPVRVETTTVTRPETVLVQRPGDPPRVDTVITTRIDSVIVTVHDTVVKHDTVLHYDTVRLARVPASICMYMIAESGDSIFLERTTAINACAPQPMAQHYIDRTHRAPDDTLVVVLFDSLIMQLGPRPPAPSRSSLILPSWSATH